MKHIGLLMVRYEDDMLWESLRNHSIFCDHILVLDGSKGTAQKKTEELCKEWPKVDEYWTDEQTSYPLPLRDGARQFLLERSRVRFGTGNWQVILHGDEIWGADPREITNQLNECPIALKIELLHFFPHVTEAPYWHFEPGKTSIEKLSKWYMMPPIPEHRLFFDDGTLNYSPNAHSRVVPPGLKDVPTNLVVKQYNYRSPLQAHLRAIDRRDANWQENHYQHLIDGPDDFFRETLASHEHQWASIVPKGEGKAACVDTQPLPSISPDSSSEYSR